MFERIKMMTGMGKSGMFQPGAMMPKAKDRHRPPQDPQGTRRGTQERNAKNDSNSSHVKPRFDRTGRKGAIVAVRIRMKMMGASIGPFSASWPSTRGSRAMAGSSRNLGTYDPMIKNKDNRVTLKPERISTG